MPKHHGLITERDVSPLLVFRKQLTVSGLCSPSEPNKCDVEREATTARFTSDEHCRLLTGGGITSCPYVSALTVRFRQGMDSILTHTDNACLVCL